MTNMLVRPMTTRKFPISNLRIAAELIGQKHTFRCDGMEVTIQLPDYSSLAEDRRFRPDNDTYVVISGIENGHSIPLSCFVRLVQISLVSNNEIPIPEVEGARGIVFYPIAAAHNAVASKAFDYWIDMLRWKLLDSHIGRPIVSNIAQSAQVLDMNTGQQLYGGPMRPPPVTYQDNGITIEQWNIVQSALGSELHMPIWFSFLFQGEYRLALGERTEVTVNFAIACDLLIRRLYWQEIPQFAMLNDVAREAVDEINIRTLMSRWKKMTFW
jgi:hypothetical protein